MDTLASVSPYEISETELLQNLTRHASENDLPFALWQLPGSGTRNLLISDEFQKLKKEQTIIEDLVSGFIFAPFDREQQSIYLRADLLFSFEKGTLKNSDDPVRSSSARWLEKNFRKTRETKPLGFSTAEINQRQTAGDSDFKSLIQLCIQELENGTFEKIVPSRTKQIQLPQDFDVLDAFQKLCERYPNALVSFVNIPGIGTWLGATPEILVSIEQGNIFKTVALAGTQPYQPNTNLRSVSWTQKEIEEQALVERYVISCFKKIRLREYDEHGPKTVVAGNLMHLRSDFTVNMKETNFPNLGTIMLDLLHPTSAVCGMPLKNSLDFLKEHEGYDRSFYSGYLGPVNIDNDVNIFVNLRCMQLLDGEAILYAGAGVTVDSVPEQEFQETEIKFNTVLNVIS
jgi:isochorismate synthase